MSLPFPSATPRTVEELSDQISELIMAAIVEADDERRHGLLMLADAWNEIRTKRSAIA